MALESEGAVDGLARMIDSSREGVRRHDPTAAYWNLEAGSIADRMCLFSVIETHIGNPQLGPRLSLSMDFRLTIDAGLGALRAAWLLVTQLVGRERAIYTCTACGNLYTRALELRAPKPGQRNYCGECRGTYTSAKKLSNADRRRTLRELVSFAEARTWNGQADWESIRGEWNELHPSAAYPTTERLLQDLMVRTRSYGVSLGCLADLLGEHSY